MSRETSASTGKRYGPQRVCQTLQLPPSRTYVQQAREPIKGVPLQPARRGPKPKIVDTDLLAAIRADPQALPFVGEGHRKVWARLRGLLDIRVFKDRVCRLMRDNTQLSPHRLPRRQPMQHDG